MRPLSESTSRVAGKNFERKYVAIGRIVQRWPQIVGEKLSAKAQPVKLHFRKHKESKQPVASLDIAVSSADATLLHYQKDLILERINQIFGEQWISSIRFVHMASNRAETRKQKQKRILSDIEKNNLSAALEIIDDPAIKERLNSLGTEILREDT